MIFTLISAQVFGKTMENVRKRVNIKVCRAVEEKKKILKLVAQPTFKRFKIFGEKDGTCSPSWNNIEEGEEGQEDPAWAIPGVTNDVDAARDPSSSTHPIVGIENRKVKVSLCKPIYVGMSILDLSKLLMYDFFYSELKHMYQDNVHLAYTDTDSFIVHVFTDDVYDDLQARSHLYDFSNYPVEHSLYSVENHCVPGKFKDKLAGRIMTEFVGIRSKAYSYIGEKCDKRAKGVKTSVLNQTISHEDYKACLFKNDIVKRDITNLSSHRHIVYGQTTSKIALSPLDTKRYVLKDGIKTLAYGHKDI